MENNRKKELRMSEKEPEQEKVCGAWAWFLPNFVSAPRAQAEAVRGLKISPDKAKVLQVARL